MGYIYIYYYDENDNHCRAWCLQLDFEGDIVTYRDENGNTREIPIKQIERIKAY